MKKLIISASSEKFGKIRKSISKLIRIGLGLSAAFSLLFSVTSRGSKHASEYEKLITKYTNKEEQTRLVTELSTCIWEATDNNPNIIKATDQYDYYPEQLPTEFTTKAISKQLQRGKINICNLDIYLLKNKNSAKEEEHWKLVKGGELFLINPTKYLLVNSSAKLMNFIQELLPERMKTQSFLFYSEVFIKVFILRLLTSILQKDSSSNGEGLEEELLETFYKLLVGFLPWSYSLVGRLPPLGIQQMVFLEWVVLCIFTTLIDAFLEKYIEKKTAKENEKEGSFWEETLQTRVVPELLSITIIYYLTTSRRRDYPTDVHVSARSIENIGWVLSIANRLFSNILKVIIYLKNKLNEEINEKVF